MINGVRGIDHVALQLSSLEEGKKFFSGILGFKVKFDITYENTRVLIMQAGKVQLEIWENKDMGAMEKPAAPLKRQGLNHLAIEVKDIRSAIEGLGREGYILIKETYEPAKGIKEAVVLGPDNIEIQLVEQNIPVLIWGIFKGKLTGNMG